MAKRKPVGRPRKKKVLTPKVVSHQKLSGPALRDILWSNVLGLQAGTTEIKTANAVVGAGREILKSATLDLNIAKFVTKYPKAKLAKQLATGF